MAAQEELRRRIGGFYRRHWFPNVSGGCEVCGERRTSDLRCLTKAGALAFTGTGPRKAMSDLARRIRARMSSLPIDESVTVGKDYTGG